MGPNEELVRRYLEGIAGHDWQAVSSCLADEVVRVGPFGDTYAGKGTYLEFISALMPTLAGYSMKVDRVISHETVAVAQLTETVEIDGKAIETPEALVFDFGPDGLVERVEIYIQRRS